MQVVLREGSIGAGLLRATLGVFSRDFVETNGRFKHEQHIEAVLADILHHAGDLLALDYRLMDSLTELLNQFAQTQCHRYLQELRPILINRGRGAGFLYLTSITAREQLAGGEVRRSKRRCYHHNGMKPHSIGRTLGIGLRVAGRIAGQRVAASTEAAANAPAASGAEVDAAANPSVQNRAAGQNARGVGQDRKNVAQGLGGFLHPFRRAGGIVWLEVTGVFFALFVIVFARALWMYRASYTQGPDHEKFVISVPLLLVFLYLSASSFWRARRR
jgi:hypothetical protein